MFRPKKNAFCLGVVKLLLKVTKRGVSQKLQMGIYRKGTRVESLQEY